MKIRVTTFLPFSMITDLKIEGKCHMSMSFSHDDWKDSTN